MLEGDDPATLAEAEGAVVASGEDVADEPAEDEEEAPLDEEEVIVPADDTEEVVEEVAAPAAVVRPARPTPGRPPSAKDEPEPPFLVGERIRLTQNTRPRTGAALGPYPVGVEGRVETVLSLTAVVRFDMAPDVKEVVAFTCLESIDEDAQRRRAERDAQNAAATS